jgi:hypothetical protein
VPFGDQVQGLTVLQMKKPSTSTSDTALAK